MDKINSTESHAIEPIGLLHSPFTEKFGIPRQANLITSTSALVELLPPYNQSDTCKGLQDFSHIWLTFKFHANDNTTWRPLIRPPRLGGNSKVGVFASRSSFRPNSLGQSLVELKEVINSDSGIWLKIACPDILDGTPIFDIKPYIQYSDTAQNARCGYAQTPPEQSLNVIVSKQVEELVMSYEKRGFDNLLSLIKEVISYDPRPAYKRNTQDNKIYTMRIYVFDISFKVSEGSAIIESMTKAIPKSN